MRELIGLAMALAFMAGVCCLPQNPQTRSSPPIGDTIRQLTDQLMDVNATSQLLFDTRTPPRVQQQLLSKKEKLEIKNDVVATSTDSHPGVAEPVDDEDLIEEAKNTHFYKVDKPTTDSGLSTWILLSGQGSTKPTKKPTTKQNVTTTFVIDDVNKLIKPLFKRKPSSTKKPTTIVSTTLQADVVTTTESTDIAEKTTKLTKVKASVLASAMSKNETGIVKKPTTMKLVKTTTPTPSTPSVNDTKLTTPKFKSTTATNTTKLTALSTKKPTESPIKKTTAYVKIATKTTKPESIESNSVLSPEAKEGALDLTLPVHSKKNRKPAVTTAATITTTKKKRNKNRRKRPIADDKSDGINKTSKHREKPIGTQIYNYLSREVMPTVGVGLVGLMVTAGLASYFLYPFSPLRRTYEIDRKDKVTPYYYNDEYSGGIAEEDAIGKVIAGMPSITTLNNYNNNNNNNHQNNRAQNSRNQFNNNRYRKVDQRYMQGSVESVQLNPHTAYKIEDVIMGSPKTHYQSNSFNEVQPPQELTDKKFVVGNIPKELQEPVDSATPAIVPEHGPRTMEKENVFVVHSVSETTTENNNIEHGPRRMRRRRLRRQVENEIDSELKPYDDSFTRINTIQTTPSTRKYYQDYHTGWTSAVETTTKNPIIEKTESLIDILKDLFYYKLRLGLEILQNKTETLSRYFKSVQQRIDDSFREHHRKQM